MQYDLLTTVLAVVLAVYTSFVALDMGKRVRSADVAMARAWMVGGSLIMGLGIWSMHFEGMLAHVRSFAVGFDPLLAPDFCAAGEAERNVVLRVVLSPESQLQPREFHLGSQRQSRCGFVAFAAQTADAQGQ